MPKRVSSNIEHMFAQSADSANLADDLKSSVVLGIDPGLTRCGYAVLEVQGATQITMRALGVLRTSPDQGLPQRLAEISLEIEELLDEYQPSVVAVEHIFFNPMCVRQ